MYREIALTTIDNPFDPFEDFINWFLYDVEKNYYTCSLVDRISNVTNEMTQKEINEEIERSIDEFIKNDPLNLYIKVENVSESYEQPETTLT